MILATEKEERRHLQRGHRLDQIQARGLRPHRFRREPEAANRVRQLRIDASDPASTTRPTFQMYRGLIRPSSRESQVRSVNTTAAGYGAGPISRSLVIAPRCPGAALRRARTGTRRTRPRPSRRSGRCPRRPRPCSGSERVQHPERRAPGVPGGHRWRSVVPTVVTRGDPDALSRSTSHDPLMAAAMTFESAR
jgi:hypothetical protein